MRVPAL